MANFLNFNEQPSLIRIQKYLASFPAPNKLKNEKSSLLKTFTAGQLENMIKSMDKQIVPYFFDGGTGILTEMITDKPEPKVKTFRFLKIKTL